MGEVREHAEVMDGWKSRCESVRMEGREGRRSCGSDEGLRRRDGVDRSGVVALVKVEFEVGVLRKGVHEERAGVGNLRRVVGVRQERVVVVEVSGRVEGTHVQVGHE